MRFTVKRILPLLRPALSELLDRLPAHTLLRRGFARRFPQIIRFTVKRIIFVRFVFRHRGQSPQYLMGGVDSIALHFVNRGIGRLLLVGDYCLLCFGELLSSCLNRAVSACLLDDLFSRRFPGRLVLQRIGFLPDGFPAPGLFCFAALHISRAPAWCSSSGKAPCPAGSCSQKE